MPRVFNTTAVCIPEKHYMVNLDSRLREIRQLVDEGKYFTINRARQYGKTTLLMALNQSLKNAYYTVSLDFQTFGSAEFRTEYTFAEAFAGKTERPCSVNMAAPFPIVVFKDQGVF